MHGNVDEARVVDESLHISGAIHPIDAKVLDGCGGVFGYPTAKFHNSTNIIWLSWWFANKIDMIWTVISANAISAWGVSYLPLTAKTCPSSETRLPSLLMTLLQLSKDTILVSRD